eukprot:CAMPEP_0194168154 /NCGR_PEP_ID=MMETSP0154-20130528/3206_1 /TAXON_ID=1049557 /ORGANISM="Thalassiothrix antarctica, Strain L6-D1" /LENGTH=586 /DNA_ID=CAMNT_0038879239 /DNA_START=35 /DNA_END=1792 /DNA_ORIENTATION=+
MTFQQRKWKEEYPFDEPQKKNCKGDAIAQSTLDSKTRETLIYESREPPTTKSRNSNITSFNMKKGKVKDTAFNEPREPPMMKNKEKISARSVFEFPANKSREPTTKARNNNITSSNVRKGKDQDTALDELREPQMVKNKEKNSARHVSVDKKKTTSLVDEFQDKSDIPLDMVKALELLYKAWDDGTPFLVHTDNSSKNMVTNTTECLDSNVLSTIENLISNESDTTDDDTSNKLNATEDHTSSKTNEAEDHNSCKPNRTEVLTLSKPNTKGVLNTYDLNSTKIATSNDSKSILTDELSEVDIFYNDLIAFSDGLDSKEIITFNEPNVRNGLSSNKFGVTEDLTWYTEGSYSFTEEREHYELSEQFFHVRNDSIVDIRNPVKNDPSGGTIRQEKFKGLYAVGKVEVNNSCKDEFESIFTVERSDFREVEVGDKFTPRILNFDSEMNIPKAFENKEENDYEERGSLCDITIDDVTVTATLSGNLETIQNPHCENFDDKLARYAQIIACAHKVMQILSNGEEKSAPSYDDYDELSQAGLIDTSFADYYYHAHHELNALPPPQKLQATIDNNIFFIKSRKREREVDIIRK